VRIAVFIAVFALGVLATAFWTDDLTVCPTFDEGDAFHVTIQAWPPAALECTVEHGDGTTTVGTYVPWKQWIAVALAALGIAAFTPRRALMTVALVLLGTVLWFL
jgi:hypothetical protein